MSDIKKSELWAGFTYIAAIFVVLGMVSWLSGCGSDILLPGEAPTCVEQVTDECVPEVVAAFCPEAEACDTRAAYRAGFEAAAELCATNRPVCPDPVVCDECEACDQDDDEDSDDDECKDNGHHYGNDKPDCHGRK